MLVLLAALAAVPNPPCVGCVPVFYPELNGSACFRSSRSRGPGCSTFRFAATTSEHARSNWSSSLNHSAGLRERAKAYEANLSLTAPVGQETQTNPLRTSMLER